MLLILHTVPVAFCADAKLVRNSLLLFLNQSNIQEMTKESGERVQKMVRYILS